MTYFVALHDTVYALHIVEAANHGFSLKSTSLANKTLNFLTTADFSTKTHNTTEHWKCHEPSCHFQLCLLHLTFFN